MALSKSHDNDIEECPDSLLAGLNELKTVNMNNNKLTELGSQLLENSNNLVEFSVNNNQLESLDEDIFGGLTFVLAFKYGWDMTKRRFYV